ncbi:hypothetical protein LIER_19611 [Lithospermum erythrorhizon]|uniref:Uncharacterized protein n=1 Tax=Lithospermum erythrorhizon TaxID=34254 RepID=A0AAV3QID0_LITER
MNYGGHGFKLRQGRTANYAVVGPFRHVHDGKLYHFCGLSGILSHGYHEVGYPQQTHHIPCEPSQGCGRRHLRNSTGLVGDNPWVWTGDFNCVLSMEEATGGGAPDHHAMVDFRTCVDELEMDDLVWSGKLPRSYVNFEALGMSDHSATDISIDEEVFKFGSCFKFHEFWCNHPGYEELLKTTWSEEVVGDKMFLLKRKQDFAKIALKGFNKEHFKGDYPEAIGLYKQLFSKDKEELIVGEKERISGIFAKRIPEYKVGKLVASVGDEEIRRAIWSMCIKLVIAEFGEMSGPRPNLEKSNIFMVGDDEGKAEEISSFMQIPRDRLPVRYLGIPLNTQKMTSQDCRVLVDKIMDKIK